MSICNKCKTRERAKGQHYCLECIYESQRKRWEENPMCTKCGVNPHASNTNHCRPCINKRLKQYRKENPGATYRKLKNPVEFRKRNARILIYQLIKLGLMERKPCESCGAPAEKSEAHHYKGHEGWAVLAIQWLCHKCHREADKKLGLTKGRPRVKTSPVVNST